MKKKGNRIVPNCVKEDDLEEKIKDMEMGDVIKDFYKSDAPQFKGKSKKKRREMYRCKTSESRRRRSRRFEKVVWQSAKGDWVQKATLMVKSKVNARGSFR